MLAGEMQHNASADRATHRHRLVERERIGDLDDHAHIIARSELVFAVLPAGRRRRLAVPGHVEGDDAVVRGDARIVHQAAILPRVGAGGVQAEQGDALARLLDIEPLRLSEQLAVQITTDDGFVTRAHRAASLRGLAMTSLK